MAQNDSAVLAAAKGFILIAPVDTAAPLPADVTTFGQSGDLSVFTDYESIGHTSRDELPVFGYEGGETETKGTWQNATFKQVTTEVPSDYVTFNVHQFDQQGLSLYYGVSDPGTTAGVFEVQEASTAAINKALLIVIKDGDVAIAFHAGKAAIRREDSIELSVDELAYLPLRGTFLKGANALFSWISEDTGVNVVPAA